MNERADSRTKFSLAHAVAIIFVLAAFLQQQSFRSVWAEPSRTVKHELYDAQIEIRGVGCTGCIRRIERELRQRAGVSRAKVDFCKAGVCASIIYDPQVIKMADILKVIRSQTSDYTVKSNEPEKIPALTKKNAVKHQRLK